MTGENKYLLHLSEIMSIPCKFCYVMVDDDQLEYYYQCNRCSEYLCEYCTDNEIHIGLDDKGDTINVCCVECATPEERRKQFTPS